MKLIFFVFLSCFPLFLLAETAESSFCPKCTYSMCFNGNFNQNGTVSSEKTSLLVPFSSAQSPEECCWKCGVTRGCGGWQWLSEKSAKCYISKGNECHVAEKTKIESDSFIGGSCDPATELQELQPHFFGAYGTPFNFNSRPGNVLCLLSDDFVHVNGKLGGYTTRVSPVLGDGIFNTRMEYDENYVSESQIANAEGGVELKEKSHWMRVFAPSTTWIREIGIVWMENNNEHSMKVVARSGKVSGHGFLDLAEVDGKVLPKLRVGEEFRADGGFRIIFLKVESWEGSDIETYSISVTPRMNMTLRFRIAPSLLQEEGEAETHINVAVTHIKASEAMGGLLGETYHYSHYSRSNEYSEMADSMKRAVEADGESGAGFLDGQPDDYISTKLLSPDCRMNNYVKKASKVQLGVHSEDVVKSV